MSTRLRTLFSRLAPLALVASVGSGCADRQAQSAPTRTPDPGYTAQAYATPAREVVYTDPAQFEGVTVTGQEYAPPTADVPDMVGYETFSSGDRVTVVTYVHTYPEPIETYPRVYWSGRWYYNVNGSMVFWSGYYGGWCYYWGPPPPLIWAWNYHYP